MKLPDYAKAIGISYTTPGRWWKAGKLPHPARQVESGLILVDYLPPTLPNKARKNRVAIYSRVSSSENKNNLNRQSERLTEYAIANGYQIVRNVKEIGSGFNDHRKQLETLLQQKASFLGLDPIPVYGKTDKDAAFTGKRIKRGLYKTSVGQLINSDVNASFNILRKAIPNAFSDGIESCVVQPLAKRRVSAAGQSAQSKSEGGGT